MNMQTKLSAKGQVVIPKDVRDRMGLEVGEAFDVIETAEGIMLKRPKRGKTISGAEAVVRLREIVKYDGPTISIEDMDIAIAEMFRNAKDERF